MWIRVERAPAEISRLQISIRKTKHQEDGNRRTGVDLRLKSHQILTIRSLSIEPPSPALRKCELGRFFFVSFSLRSTLVMKPLIQRLYSLLLPLVPSVRVSLDAPSASSLFCLTAMFLLNMGERQ